MRRIASSLIVLFAACVPGAAAQSLFGSAGLGVPATPLDARARSLGAIGVGLTGFTSSLINPADVAGVPFRGVAAAFQPGLTEAEVGDESDAFGETVFPVIRIYYPANERLTLSAGFGSAFDQTWAVVRNETVAIGGTSVEARDVIRSRGGVGQVRLDAGYEVTPELAVGLAVGVHTGELERTLMRTFPDTTASLRPFEARNVWNYGGPLAVGGVRWDPTTYLRVAGSVQWSGDLDLDGEAGTASDRTVEMPIRASVGASAVLAPQLAAVLGARWTRWSDSEVEGVPTLDADNTLEIGGGIEWEGASVANRALPLRIGYHRGELPFRLGGGSPTENIASLGAGIRLSETELGPLGVVDAALERGWRDVESETNVAETFWRFTLSVALFGR